MKRLHYNALMVNTKLSKHTFASYTSLRGPCAHFPAPLSPADFDHFTVHAAFYTSLQAVLLSFACFVKANEWGHPDCIFSMASIFYATLCVAADTVAHIFSQPNSILDPHVCSVADGIRAVSRVLFLL